MTDSVIVYVDIGGIQEYIFGSNRLRENIGASYLVKHASTTWVDATQPSGEKIFAGGGKACLLFQTQASAKAWTKAYTRRALKESPGLRVAVGHSAPFEYDPHHSDLSEQIKHAQDDAKQIESRYAPFAPTLGLGVTVPCRSTGLVAVGQRRAIPGIPRDEGDYPVSHEIWLKNAVASRTSQQPDSAMGDLLAHLPELDHATNRYSIARDFDDFGRATGDYSYLAVVHADGNGIGDLFRGLHRSGLVGEAYCAAYHALSALVNTLGARAMNTVVATLVAALPGTALKDVVRDLKVDPKIKLPYFPLRPLVYGGDDITFVCDARLGFPLTTVLLNAFETASTQLLKDFKARHAVEDFPDQLTACAGITIFKTHYPFARAYAMSEELCQSAKNFSDRVTGKTVSALDWQIAPSGRVHDLAELRDLEYDQNRLTLRPVLLDSDQTWRTWQNVAKALDHFAEDWRERRNKLIAFQDVNRQGRQATENWQRTLRDPLDLPAFGTFPPSTTWALDDAPLRGETAHKRSFYFDVIELLEQYRVLEAAIPEKIA